VNLPSNNTGIQKFYHYAFFPADFLEHFVYLQRVRKPQFGSYWCCVSIFLCIHLLPVLSAT
jgi:hypothetical protein